MHHDLAMFHDNASVLKSMSTFDSLSVNIIKSLDIPVKHSDINRVREIFVLQVYTQIKEFDLITELKTIILEMGKHMTNFRM